MKSSGARPGPSLPAALAALGGRVLRWAPVWLPAALCLQLALTGALPAWREGSRLDAAEEVMRGRVDALASERARLERDLEKLADPIYRERVRRSARVAGAPLLTLDRPFVGAEAGGGDAAAVPAPGAAER